MRNFSIGLFLLSIILIGACGKASVESETKRWKHNQDRITSLKAIYPSFSTALDKTFDEANAAMLSAERLTEEAKVEAMANANRHASASFIRDLDRMEDLVQDIEDKITKAKQSTTKQNDQSAAWDAARRADTAIREAKRKLSFANVKEIAAANAITKAVKTKLDAAEKRLDEVMKVAKETAQKQEKTEKLVKETEKKAKADIVCGYCKSKNAAGAKQCGKCSAPL